MTRRLTLADVLLSFALYAGIVIVPAILVNAAIWVWHLPIVGCPLCLIALVAFCWVAARWVWRSA